MIYSQNMLETPLKYFGYNHQNTLEILTKQYWYYIRHSWMQCSTNTQILILILVSDTRHIDPWYKGYYHHTDTRPHTDTDTDTWLLTIPIPTPAYQYWEDIGSEMTPIPIHGIVGTQGYITDCDCTSKSMPVSHKEGFKQTLQKLTTKSLFSLIKACPNITTALLINIVSQI